MIVKSSVKDEGLPWRSSAFHVAARYKEVGHAEGLVLLYTEVKAGGRILPHAPKCGELLYCLEGEGVFLLDESESPCHEGDCFVAPRDSVRGVVNAGATPLRLLIIQTSSEGWSLRALLPLLHR